MIVELSTAESFLLLQTIDNMADQLRDEMTRMKSWRLRSVLARLERVRDRLGESFAASANDTQPVRQLNRRMA
jgi:hypothetical protein